MHNRPLDIAVIGLHVRLPGAETPWELIENLNLAKVAIKRTKMSDGEPFLRSERGIINNADCFDGDLFGYSQQEAYQLCPQHRLVLEGCWQALFSAGYRIEEKPHNTALYASCSANPNHWHGLLKEINDPIQEYQILLNNDKDFLATRVAYQLNLSGPCMTVQSACSSSLVSLHQASRALMVGDCDMALVASSSVVLPQEQTFEAIEGMIFSSSGRCCPYTDLADGTIPGMGVVVLVLKRLSDARKDGDDIWGVIKGSAVNNDGNNKMSFTSPAVDSQIAAMERALDMANVKPEEINFIEGHGTGTFLGDALEIAAINETYGRDNANNNCYLGSLKANIGHLDAASGLASVAKVLVSFRSNAILPQPYAQQASCNLAPNIQLNDHPVPLTTKAYAAVNSLGVGGTNVHMIFAQEENCTQQEASTPSFYWLPLSAPTEIQLQTQIQQLKLALSYCKTHQLRDIAATLQYLCTNEVFRTGFVVKNWQELMESFEKPVKINHIKNKQSNRIKTDDPLSAHGLWLEGGMLKIQTRPKIISLPAPLLKRTPVPLPKSLRTHFSNDNAQKNKVEEKNDASEPGSVDTCSEAPTTSTPRGLSAESIDPANKPRGVEFEMKCQQTLRDQVILAWQSVLGNKIWQGTENFFQAGGDSLAAIQLMQLINKATGLSLSSLSVFDNPTLNDLITFVQQQKHAVRTQASEDIYEEAFEEL